VCEQTTGHDLFCRGNLKVREEHRLRVSENRVLTGGRSDEGGESYIMRSLMICFLCLIQEPYYIEQASFVTSRRYSFVLVGCRLCRGR
jgi:hypothetical protein